MSEQRFEYVAVHMGIVGEQKATEKINSVAEHGWRLTQVVPGSSLLVFERPISG